MNRDASNKSDGCRCCAVGGGNSNGGERRIENRVDDTAETVAGCRSIPRAIIVVVIVVVPTAITIAVAVAIVVIATV